MLLLLAAEAKFRVDDSGNHGEEEHFWHFRASARFQKEKGEGGGGGTGCQRQATLFRKNNAVPCRPGETYTRRDVCISPHNRFPGSAAAATRWCSPQGGSSSRRTRGSPSGRRGRRRNRRRPPGREGAGGPAAGGTPTGGGWRWTPSWKRTRRCTSVR